MTSQSKNKKDLILDSAEKVFLEKGFYPTKIEEIARNAGIAKGTVYIYFKDKESIYISLIERKLNEVSNFIEDIIKENISSSEKLEKIYFRMCEFIVKTQKFQSLISIENIQTLTNMIDSLKEQIIPKVKGLIEAIAKIIEEGVRERKFEDIDPLLGALIFMGYLRLAILLPVMEKLYSLEISMDKDSTTKKILDVFFHGIYLNRQKNFKGKKCSE